jgi:hypothetical protein
MTAEFEVMLLTKGPSISEALRDTGKRETPPKINR